jgi:hypothetical protein
MQAAAANKDAMNRIRTINQMLQVQPGDQYVKLMPNEMHPAYSNLPVDANQPLPDTYSGLIKHAMDFYEPSADELGRYIHQLRNKPYDNPEEYAKANAPYDAPASQFEDFIDDPEGHAIYSLLTQEMSNPRWGWGQNDQREGKAVWGEGDGIPINEQTNKWIQDNRARLINELQRVIAGSAYSALSNPQTQAPAPLVEEKLHGALKGKQPFRSGRYSGN